MPAPTHQPAPQPPRLILASRSPRRAQLLREAGFAFTVATPPFDDPAQPDAPTDGDVAELAAALARQKAASLAAAPPPDAGPAVLIAADTLCIDAAGQPLGKPQTREQLLAMLRQFVNAQHQVTTGVCLHLINTPPVPPTSFADLATVTWDRVTEQQLAAYADTDTWQGKAGGYNLDERIADGWPITVQGDPATVTGLPMRRLVPLLEKLGIATNTPTP